MSSERDMRRRVVAALRPLHAVSVENGVGPGTPDVNYADGWVELKSIEGWPKRPETVVAVDHFSPGQRLWLRTRAAAGGACWLLLKVGRDWLLFEGGKAAEVVGRATRVDLVYEARAFWAAHLREEDLLRILRG